MPPKRSRKAAGDDATNHVMEESATALAGVEGALKTTAGGAGKRKASSGTGTSKRLSKKAVKKERSNSLEELTEVAGILLKGTSDELFSVPDPMDPMATAAAAAAAAAVPLPSLPTVKSGGEQPTGFRKKPALPKKSSDSSKAVKAATGGDGKKTQIQYNPDVPMNKEQLTAWRREMRRVRNRESAAASRRKVRDRIEELEEEVKCWKERYEEVIARLGEAEAMKKEANV